MNRSISKEYLDLDIKIQLGNTLLNILYVNYLPPTPSWRYSNYMHSSYELHFIPSGKGTLLDLIKNITFYQGLFILQVLVYITSKWQMLMILCVNTV